MNNLFAKAAELEQSHRSFALATIISAVGSTPRSNARMIITEDGETYGTVGGGLAESYVIEEAKKRIASRESGTVSYRLDNQGTENSIEMLCGGNLEVFIEVVSSADDLILIGGGHVNLEIARLGHEVGLAITIVETRSEFSSKERFPMAKEILCEPSLQDALEKLHLNERSAVVIATHDHDMAALQHLIEKPSGYIGMLGSRRKVSYLKGALQEGGINTQDLKKLYAPAGFDIGAETPQQIAVSIISEVLAVMNNTSGLNLSRRAQNLVLVRGGGDIASGTVVRLRNSGFRVAVLETERPTVIRRTVSFAQAVYDGEIELEGIKAKYTDSFLEAKTLMDEGTVPVLSDPEGKMISSFSPMILVDAILAKKNLGTAMDMAPLVIGLGPGFSAGKDVDLVIETNRGHDLGRVITSGEPAADTGVPGTIDGVTGERVLRSPADGEFTTEHEIGDMVKAGEVIATCGDQPVKATIDGVIRGLLVSGLPVTKGYKIGDIDPRGDATYCHRISDKSRAVAGGVLEGIMRFMSHMMIR
ncbi:MAG: selenium-dependent molybdenum cofactor biosynthesis protein YqeB [Spirochaetota bacterium]